MGANIAACQDWAIRAPKGTRKRPVIIANPKKLSTFGNKANWRIAAQTAARPTPTVKLIAAAYDASAFGASTVTVIAAKVMAEAPFGHSVRIQKSSTAAIIMKARAALRRAGDHSAMKSLA